MPDETIAAPGEFDAPVDITGKTQTAVTPLGPMVLPDVPSAANALGAAPLPAVAASALPTNALAPRSPLDIIAQYESAGGQNIPNAQGSGAFGPWQILRSTWNDSAAKAGVDVSKYPTQQSAPVDVQKQVAQYLYNTHGYAPWAPYNPALARAVGWTGPMYNYSTGKMEGALASGGGAPATTPSASGSGLPDLNALAGRLSSGLADTMKSEIASNLASGVGPTSAPNQMAMMALLAAGTHKFVPISYDPFAAQRVGTATAPVGPMPRAPDVTAAAPQVAPPPRVAPYRLGSIGGKTQPGNLGMDPQLQNMFAGVE